MIPIVAHQEYREPLLPTAEATGALQESVQEILATVKRDGDAALRDYAKRFDGVCPSQLEVKVPSVDEATAGLCHQLRDALVLAAEHIREFHSCQLRDDFEVVAVNGRRLMQKVIPLQRVGIYVPGGRAAYPSTVLMNAIPAQVAGCEEIVMVTPPRKDGTIDPVVLAAAALAGVNRLFAVGGAQAIAALTFGTETIPAVDKIVGPGNAYVAEAKRQVYGRVSIDMLAGPSEILIVADETADPRYVAADLIAQAEHDPEASAVLLTTHRRVGEGVQEELRRQLQGHPREAVATASLQNHGKIVLVDTVAEAIDLANEAAPEHLELMVAKAEDWAEHIRCAGSVFLGAYTPETIGDYVAGTNHTLPTMGTARFQSPLSVDDFVKNIQFLQYTPTALLADGPAAETLAAAEGLWGHKQAVTLRLEDLRK